MLTQTNFPFSFLTDRTAAEIAREQDVDMGLLKDPQEDKDRVQGDPKWYVRSNNKILYCSYSMLNCLMLLRHCRCPVSLNY